jgi:hypothetical protein
MEEIRDAISEQCREDGMTLYKAASTLDLVGIKVAMEEEELEKLVGKDPVYMAGEGYLALGVNIHKLVESRRTLFVGEKRERTESVEGDGEEIGGWARKHHEWLFKTVSGAGGWKAGKDMRKDKSKTRFSKDISGSASRIYFSFFK